MPRARKDGIVVKEMPDEVLVYDLERDKAHCLNQSAAFVWKQCNGRRTVGEAARALGKHLKSPVDEQVVWMAIDQLDRFNLLAERVARPSALPRMSRRDLVRLGITAVAVPTIISIVAPTAANAQTAISPSVCNARTQPNCGGTPCTGGGGTQTCQNFQTTACRCA